MRTPLSLLPTLALLGTTLLHAQTYPGTPYTDSHHPTGAQTIPGIVQCAYYDRGGEGVAYHDTTPVNLGSGTLNPKDGTYLNQFRMDEAVDTSYTKQHTDVDIDFTPYETVQPPPNQLYIGWTEPGEWFKLTVDVQRAGRYTADLLYTSNRGGSLTVDVDDQPAGSVAVASTFNAADPVAWRQWHHWNRTPAALTLDLPAGKHVLTIHIATGGQMNLASFDFQAKQ